MKVKESIEAVCKWSATGLVPTPPAHSMTCRGFLHISMVYIISPLSGVTATHCGLKCCEPGDVEQRSRTLTKHVLAAVGNIAFTTAFRTMPWIHAVAVAPQETCQHFGFHCVCRWRAAWRAASIERRAMLRRKRRDLASPVR